MAGQSSAKTAGRKKVSIAGRNNGTNWGANSTYGGASVRSDRREGRAAGALAMGPQHRSNKTI